MRRYLYYLVIAFLFIPVLRRPVSAALVENVFEETTVIKRGGNAFRIELATACTYQVIGTTDVPVTVKLWLQYNSSYDMNLGSPTVNLYGCGINSTAAVTSAALNNWELLIVSGTPTSEGVLDLTIRSYSSAAGSKVYFDEVVVISTLTVDTCGGDFFDSNDEPAVALLNTETTPRLYSGSADYFVWDSSSPSAMIFQKYYEPPLISTGFAATTLSTGSIRWDWADNSSGKKDEDEFKVFTSTDGLLSVISANTTYWLETGLTLNTTYWRYVQSWNVVGSSNSPTISTVTLCNNPSGVNWGPVFLSSLTVTWTQAEVPANPASTVYVVQLSTAINFTGQIFSSTTVRSLQSAIVDGLTINTTYYGRVAARNWGLADTVSDIATSTKTIGYPSAPSGVYGVVNSSIQITWNWTDNSSGELQETGFKIYCATSSTLLYTTGADVTSWIRSGLIPNTTYQLYVQAYNINGSNNSPNAAKVTLCAAPNNPVFSTAFVSSMTVNWGVSESPANPGNTIYLIQLSTVAGFTETIYSSQTVRSYQTAIVKGLTVNTTYYGRVLANNWENNSVTANISGWKATVCSKPDNPVWQKVNSSSITVSWGTGESPANYNNTVYIAQVSTANDFTGDIYSSQTIRSSLATTVIDLAGRTTYYGRVIARNWSSEDVYSDIITSTETIWWSPYKPVLTEPLDNVWQNYSSTVCWWNYSDPYSDPQKKYQVQFSTLEAFGLLYSDSGEVSSIYSSATVSGLGSNNYWWRVRTKNMYLWSVWSSTRALNVDVDAPCGQQLTFLTVHSSSVSYTWSASTYTTVSGMHSLPYWIEWSSNSFGAISGNSGWLAGASSITFSGVLPNTKYQFRLKARNAVENAGPWSTVATSSYTYIQTPTSISFDTLGISSFIISGITVSGGGSSAFTNLTLNFSGLLFSEARTGTNSNWTLNNTWPKDGLTANTTYSFALKARNAESPVPVETVEYGPVIKATKIESVNAGSVKWEVGSSSIGVTADGTFTDLGNGNSGINYTICTSSWQWTNTGVSSSVWVKDGATYYFTVYNGADPADPLTPNSTYYFISNSRNYDGVLNSSISYITKISACKVPGASALDTSSLSSTQLKVTINQNGNNAANTYSRYAIWASSESEAGSGKYVQWSDIGVGSFGSVSEDWRTYTQWGAGSGVIVSGLIVNTSYWVKVKARNLDGIATAFGVSVTTATQSSVPTSIAISTSAGFIGRFDISWLGNGTGYYVQLSTEVNNWGGGATSGWQTANTYQPVNLSTNTKYYSRIKSRNMYSVESSWSSGDDYNWVLADTAKNTQIAQIWLTSTTVQWSGGTNPAQIGNGAVNTYYRVQLSSDDFATIFDDKGFNQYDGVLIDTFTGLSKNTYYKTRVRARSGDGTVGYAWTDWSVSGSSCTLIDAPSNISVSGITLTNANLTANGLPDLSDSGGDGSYWELRQANNSNLYLSVTTPPQATNWRDGSSGSAGDIFGNNFTYESNPVALLPNTTHQFRVKAKNKESKESGWTDWVVICSSIQKPTGVELVSATSWYLRVRPTGTFSNLGAGATVSAICVWKEGEAEPDQYEQPGAIWKTNTGDYKQFAANSDTAVYFYTKSRNQYGKEQRLLDPTTYYTLAEVPGSVSFKGSVFTSTSHITIDTFISGGGTQYAVKVTSTNDQAPNLKWVQADGLLGSTTYWAVKNSWESKQLVGLTANTSYQASVCAKNSQGTETAYSGQSSKWTKIEGASGITVLEISTNSVKCKVESVRNDNAFSNLGSGLSEIHVSTGADADTGYHSVTSTTVYQFTGLELNKEYTIYAKPYCGDGATASASTETITATRIEASTGVVFGTVTENSVALKTANTFTDPTLLQSGWSVYCVGLSSESGFYQDATYTTWHTFTTLSANSTYYFKTRSRNRNGLLNDWSAEFAKVTKAKSVSSIQLVAVDSGTVTVTFTDPGNTADTKYRIAVSSTNWLPAGIKYVQSTGLLGSATVWQTRENWGGDSGKDVKDLNPNTQYKFKVMA
ncbi:MAG: fibronectin type III domain-containing protein, partial [Elusimicrobiota bacterium]